MTMTTGVLADRRVVEGGPAAVIVDPPPIVEPPPLAPAPIEPAPIPLPERFPQDDPPEPDRRPMPQPRPTLP